MRVRLLLDTHSFLWWVNDDPRLSETARRIIGSDENSLLLSAACVLEVVIKAQSGRLQLTKPADVFIVEQMAKNELEPLHLTISHALAVYELPLHHRDPFDRLLIAQSRLERLPIITRDPVFRDYGVEVVW